MSAQASLAGWATTLCVGEALVALVPADGQPLEHTARLDVVAAGAELNVAIHLARLGLPVRFAGLVGDDPFGRRLRASLTDEGVEVSQLETHPSRPTGLYVKTVEAGRSSMLYYRRGSAASALTDIPPRSYDGVGHLHLTGITPALSSECRGAIHRALAERGARTTSFDVNYRRALWGPDIAAPVLAELANLATVAFVGLDEANQLWGCVDAASVREVLSEPDELVVKDGSREATAFIADETATAAALSVDVLDVVGAGDAFAAGYLAARWRGEAAGGALRAGHQLAATVIGSYSDHGRPDGVAAPAADHDAAAW